MYKTKERKKEYKIQITKIPEGNLSGTSTLREVRLKFLTSLSVLKREKITYSYLEDRGSNTQRVSDLKSVKYTESKVQLPLQALGSSYAATSRARKVLKRSLTLTAWNRFFRFFLLNLGLGFLININRNFFVTKVLQSAQAGRVERAARRAATAAGVLYCPTAQSGVAV
jgi:hypothetical protein